MASKEKNKLKCFLCYENHSSSAQKGFKSELYSVTPLFKKAFDIRYPGIFSQYGQIGFCNVCYKEKIQPLDDLYRKLVDIENKFNQKAKAAAYTVIDSIKESQVSNNNPNGNPFDSIRFLIHERWINNYNSENQNEEQAALEAAADLEKKRALKRCNPPNTITVTIRGPKPSSSIPSSATGAPKPIGSLMMLNGITSALGQKLTVPKHIILSKNVNNGPVINPNTWKVGRPSILSQLETKPKSNVNASSATPLQSTGIKRKFTWFEPTRPNTSIEVVPQSIRKSISSDGVDDEFCPTDGLEVVMGQSDNEEEKDKFVGISSDEESTKVVPSISKQSPEMIIKKGPKEVEVKTSLTSPRPIDQQEESSIQSEKETDKTPDPLTEKETQILTTTNKESVETEENIEIINATSETSFEESIGEDQNVQERLDEDQTELPTQVITRLQVTETLDSDEEIFTAQTISTKRPSTDLDEEKSEKPAPVTTRKSSRSNSNSESDSSGRSNSILLFDNSGKEKDSKLNDQRSTTPGRPLDKKRTNGIEEILSSSSMEILGQPRGKLDSSVEIPPNSPELFSSSSSNTDSLPSPQVNIEEDPCEASSPEIPETSPPNEEIPKETELAKHKELAIETNKEEAKEDEVVSSSTKEKKDSAKPQLNIRVLGTEGGKMKRAVIFSHDGKIIKRIVMKSRKELNELIAKVGPEEKSNPGDSTDKISTSGPRNVFVQKNNQGDPKKFIIYKKSPEELRDSPSSSLGRPKKSLTQAIVHPITPTSPAMKKVKLIQLVKKNEMGTGISKTSGLSLSSSPIPVESIGKPLEQEKINETEKTRTPIPSTSLHKSVKEGHVPNDQNATKTNELKICNFESQSLDSRADLLTPPFAPIPIDVKIPKNYRKRTMTTAIPLSERAERVRRKIKKTFDSSNWASGPELDKLLKDVEKDGRKAKKAQLEKLTKSSTTPEHEHNPILIEGNDELTQRIQIENGVTDEIIPFTMEEMEMEGARMAGNLEPEGAIHYKCPWCSEECDNQDDLQIHIIEHKKSSKAPKFNLNVSISNSATKCQKCDLTFPTNEDLKVHKSSHQDKFICEICGLEVYSQMSLKVHMTSHAFACTKCDESFDTESKLEGHMNTMHQKMFKCEFCYMSYPTEVQAIVHQEKYHKDTTEDVKCARCSKTFAMSSDLKEHQKEQVTVHTVQCSMCTETFVWNCALRVHMKLHYPGRFFKRCEECRKSFTSRADWDKHNEMHEDEME